MIALRRIDPGFSRAVLVIGLLGGSLFLLAGFFSFLPWAVSGPIAGVLLGSWFGGEIKERLDRAGEKGKETRVIRFGQKAALENDVSEMRTEGAKMGIVPRDPNRASNSSDDILGCNGEEATETET